MYKITIPLSVHLDLFEEFMIQLKPNEISSYEQYIKKTYKGSASLYENIWTFSFHCEKDMNWFILTKL